jgi:hypothetical protein
MQVPSQDHYGFASLPVAYRFAFCFNFIFTATPRSTYLFRAAETQREMLARHHAMTAGEKVRRWPSGDRRVEEDSDVIGSIWEHILLLSLKTKRKALRN